MNPFLSFLMPDWLACSAKHSPERLAIQYGTVQWSFAELNLQVTRMARQLATAGVQEGNRVAIVAANSLSYTACVHALTRLGAILVPLNTRLTLDELCWQIGDVHPMFLISDAQHEKTSAEIGQRFSTLLRITLSTEAQNGATLLSKLPEANVPLRDQIDLNAAQAILYTSGTTGQPKGAIITYGMQWWNAVGSALNLGHNPDDRWLACLPFFHIGGLSILIRSIIYGISVIALEKFDAQVVNKAIQADSVTIISVVAVMLQRMLPALDASENDARYPSTLRCVLLGGGPAPRPLLEDCAQRNIPVVQTYGLTESCSQAVTLAPTDALRKLGSAGLPLLPVQLRIMRDGHPVPANESGEIYLSGPTITPGYVGRSEANAKAFHDGWFATGDIGYLDDEGYLYVQDRRSDLIISGGENVYPAEIESVLLTHPAVEEVGVCGQDDPQWGQVPIAFAHLYAGSSTSAEDLLSYARHHLAGYKQPRAIYITGQLPRNSSGKLVRRELRKLFV